MESACVAVVYNFFQKKQKIISYLIIFCCFHQALQSSSVYLDSG